jgi:hypothetical protein
LLTPTRTSDDKADSAARIGRAYVRGCIPDPVNRQKDDFYPTPPIATRALLGVETFEGPIWECACGDGAISKILEAAGHTVISTDLVDRGYGTQRIDFLMEYRARAPNIVTNPPFKFAREFVDNALRLTTGKVAILARLAWLEGKSRRELFERSPLARVWVFSERVPIVRNGDEMMAGGGGMIAFAWFVWEHGFAGKPTLGWI